MPLQSTSYDYIFLGAGCASLSLLMRMIDSGQFKEQRILLIDKQEKMTNDRTWCFWEREAGFFENIVYRRWHTISFLSDTFQTTKPIGPYQYKMIRGIDFYRFCFNEIAKNKNIEIVYGEFNDIVQKEASILLTIDNKEYHLGNRATTIFNSIYQPAQAHSKTIRLLQHFKGWVIETNDPVFDTQIATIMDFRVHQDHGTAFVYLLPFSANSALVEYTLFTKALLPSEQYDIALDNYIRSFTNIRAYRVLEPEFGVIPMTNEKFYFRGKWGWNIGTAGGQTKASSGYTFRFIQQQSEKIVALLLAGKPLHQLPQTPGRFRFYDHTLLHILNRGQLQGKDIFTRLFKKNKPQQVFKFLDNESNIREELSIIRSLPTWPFLKAALHQC